MTWLPGAAGQALSLPNIFSMRRDGSHSRRWGLDFLRPSPERGPKEGPLSCPLAAACAPPHQLCSHCSAHPAFPSATEHTLGRHFRAPSPACPSGQLTAPRAAQASRPPAAAQSTPVLGHKARAQSHAAAGHTALPGTSGARQPQLDSESHEGNLKGVSWDAQRS